MIKNRNNLVDSTDATLDTFLAGRLNIIQPKIGYRISMDSIFLAAFISPRKESSILDIGAGCGILSLLLPIFFPQAKSCSIIGVEKDPFLCHLMEQNIYKNGLQEQVQVLCRDILEASARLGVASNHFDYVITNPPFYDGMKVSLSARRTQALHAAGMFFENWIKRSISFLKPGGIFVTIIPPARLEGFLKVIEGKLGALRLFPLWPKEGEEAHRIIIQGIKARKTKLTLESGLILHTAQGEYTDRAQRVLKGGYPLERKTGGV